MNSIKGEWWSGAWVGTGTGIAVGLGLYWLMQWLRASPPVVVKHDAHSLLVNALKAREQKGNAEEEVVEDYKMVLLINLSLKMQHGKIAAQVGHATLGAYQDALIHHSQNIQKWESCGTPKIALKVPTEEELLECERKAKEAGLPCYLVMDAGRTQVAAGSRTVLAIGPGLATSIDQITRQFKLY